MPETAYPTGRRLCCCGSASVCQTQVDDVLAGNTVVATTTLATTTLATTTLATTTLAATTLAATATTESSDTPPGTPGLYFGLEGESCDGICSQQNLTPNDGSNYINSGARLNAALVVTGADPAICSNDYRRGTGVYAPGCEFAHCILTSQQHS